MSERVAVVGNREGADMQSVVQFMDALHAEQPDSIVISGGAAGVDQMGESTWFRLGGRIRSYRPARWPSDEEGSWGIEVWNYGGTEPAYVLPVQEQRVSFREYAQACLYRDWLIAEDCDRLVAFYRDRTASMFSGAAVTESLARDRAIPTYAMVASAAA